MKKNTVKNYTYAVGRRRTASARVRLYKGSSESLINDKKISEYLVNKLDQLKIDRPFTLTSLKGKFFFTAKVVGGGKESQIEAIVHGISRALTAIDSEKNRLILKNAGLLTRDARERQRRMVGTGGKARRQKQSPKR